MGNDAWFGFIGCVQFQHRPGEHLNKMQEIDPMLSNVGRALLFVKIQFHERKARPERPFLASDEDNILQILSGAAGDNLDLFDQIEAEIEIAEQGSGIGTAVMG